MCDQVEVDHRLSADAEAELVHHLVDVAGGDVARHQVAVLGIHVLEEVPAVGLRHLLAGAGLLGILGNPDAAAFAAGRLRHQAQFVFAGNAGGMHLDHFAVAVGGALLIERALRRAGADHGVGGLAEDGADSAGGHEDGIGREGDDLHRAQVHGADAAADALRIEHGGEELPVLVLA